jgi:hypothetical protein
MHIVIMSGARWDARHGMVARVDQFWTIGKATWPLLLEAGFARRDAEYLPLAIESLGRLASRIGW